MQLDAYLNDAPTVISVLITLAAIVTALSVLAKFGPLRKPAVWIAQRLVIEPLSEWFRRMMREEATDVVRAELKRPNGGASIPDLSNRIEDFGNRLVELTTYTHNGVHRLNGQVGQMWLSWAKEHGIDIEKLPPPQPSPKES